MGSIPSSQHRAGHDHERAPCAALALIRTLAALCLWLLAPHVYAQMPSEFDLADFDAVRTAQGSTLMLPRSGKAPRALLVLLPYTDGSAQDLLRLWYAESLPDHVLARGYLLLIPELRGARTDYRGRGAWQATLERYQQALDADIDEAVRDYGADASRVVLAGHSMGGDLAWALPLREPERYAGAVIMGSQASYRDSAALARLAERGVRLFLYTGDADPRRKSMRSAIALLDEAGVAHRETSAPGRHVPAPASLFLQGIDYAFGHAGDFSAPRAWAYERAVETQQRVDQRVTCAWQPYRDRTSGLFGYRDARGKIPVPPRFVRVGDFGADGLAPIDEGDTVGYLDCAARAFATIIVDGKPDDFREGLARFEQNGRIGYLNRRGQVVIAARYDRAEPFCGGFARVQREGRTMLLDVGGKEIADTAAHGCR